MRSAPDESIPDPKINKRAADLCNLTACLFSGNLLRGSPDTLHVGPSVRCLCMNNHETVQADVSQQVSHEEISRRAQELWRQSGSPQGRDEEIWLEAERQLRVPSLSLSASSSPSESTGAQPSAAETPTSFTREEKPNARETELMEQKRSSGSKTARSKSKYGGK